MLANIKAGATVSLVSIPLSISLAVASGATPIMGIITAIWAGIFAAFLGGSIFNVVGPTGALSALILSFVLRNGIAYLPFLALVSGIFIFIAYLIRAEKYLKFFPALAVQGFTLGVAFMIAFGQATYALGILQITKHEKFIDNLIELVKALPQANLVNLGIFAVVLAGLFLALKYIKKIPAAIIFSVLGIFLGILSQNHLLPFTIYTLADKYNLSFSLFGTFKPLLSPGILSTAMTVAVVAILETMISARIADGMTGTKHNPRKEMLGLSIANIVSGLSGGMPATAALARTSLNIKSGASTKISTITNGIAVLTISFFLFSYFRYLPLAVIAAILVFTAVRMIERDHLSKLYNYSKKEFYLTIFVALVCIVEDSIVGLLVGAVIGLLLLVYKQSLGTHLVVVNSRGEKSKSKEPEVSAFRNYKNALNQNIKDSSVVVYSIRGPLVFINGQEHLTAIQKLAEKYKTIVIRLRTVSLVDLDGVEILNEIISDIKEKGVDIYICGVNKEIERYINLSKEYRHLQDEDKVFVKTTEVLNKLGFRITH